MDDPFQPTNAHFHLRKKKKAKKNSPKRLFSMVYDGMGNYISSTDASGAFFFTEAIPFSMADSLEYISLLPIT